MFVQTFGGGSMLMISGVADGDAGVYQCVGKNRYGLNYSDNFDLQIVPGKCLHFKSSVLYYYHTGLAAAELYLLSAYLISAILALQADMSVNRTKISDGRNISTSVIYKSFMTAAGFMAVGGK